MLEFYPRSVLDFSHQTLLYFCLRYAFTPIVDFDDDEEDNVTLSEAFGKDGKYWAFTSKTTGIMISQKTGSFSLAILHITPLLCVSSLCMCGCSCSKASSLLLLVMIRIMISQKIGSLSIAFFYNTDKRKTPWFYLSTTGTFFWLVKIGFWPVFDIPPSPP